MRRARAGQYGAQPSDLLPASAAKTVWLDERVDQNCQELLTDPFFGSGVNPGREFFCSPSSIITYHYAEKAWPAQGIQNDSEYLRFLVIPGTSSGSCVLSARSLPGRPKSARLMMLQRSHCLEGSGRAPDRLNEAIDARASTEPLLFSQWKQE
jgi:hypothetical protein